MQSNILWNSQQILERNEDTIQAILENFQRSRYDDCAKHYSLLQSNLISLAVELDNYPPSNVSCYQSLDIFPDEIMQKDILEDIKESGDRILPSVIPSCCNDCMKKQFTDQQCRLIFQHVEPSHNFTQQQVD